MKVSCGFVVLEAVDILDVEVEIVVFVDVGVIVLVFEVTVDGAPNVDDAAAPEWRVGLLPGPGVADGSPEKKRGAVSPVSWKAEPLAGEQLHVPASWSACPAVRSTENLQKEDDERYVAAIPRASIAAISNARHATCVCACGSMISAS